MSKWRAKQELEKPVEDSAMKQMARALFSAPVETFSDRVRNISVSEQTDNISPASPEPKTEIEENISSSTPTIKVETKSNEEGIRQVHIPALQKSETFLEKPETAPITHTIESSEQEIVPIVASQIINKKSSPPVVKAKKIEIETARKKIQSPKLKADFHIPKNTRRFSSFNEVVAFTRNLLPLPTEMQLKQKPEYYTWLMGKIANCHNQSELTAFAYSLNYKDLAILFPALATLKKGEEIERLLSIILMRASKYLYVQGWITLQYAYPRSTVQKGLALLCEVLEERSEDEKIRLSSEDEFVYDGLELGEERFDWHSVHLISEISLPNTRHFLSSLIKFIRDSNISGHEFFHRYGIYRDLPLGQAITRQWEVAVFDSSINSADTLRSLFSGNE